MRKVTGLWMAVCLALLVLGLRWHPLWGAALAVGGCAGISRFLSARPGRRARRFAGRPDGAELAAVMEAADRELKQLRLYADRIADRRTRDAAAALADIGGRVYDELCRRPERIPSAGRLLAARLDAAGQLLIRYAAYQEAFAKEIGIYGSSYTNTMMVELGHTLHFAAGSEKNIKLTTKDDLELFKAYLRMEAEP